MCAFRKICRVTTSVYLDPSLQTAAAGAGISEIQKTRTASAPDSANLSSQATSGRDALSSSAPAVSGSVESLPPASQAASSADAESDVAGKYCLSHEFYVLATIC